MATAQLVFRRGKHNERNFTPRPGIDTVGPPGQAPGLSTFESLVLRRGDVAQVIDVTLLTPPLHAIPDDPALGGTPGHVAIVPVDPGGDVDQALLDEWAATYGQVATHSLTLTVINAVVQRNVRQQP